MNPSHWRTIVVLVLFVSGMAGLEAQSVSQPSVQLHRNPNLHRMVRPGDFNNDGIIDLVATDGTPGPSALVIALGRADGTFAAPRTAGMGQPVATGDFNNDGNLDVLSMFLPAPDELIILYVGNGDGTLVSRGQVSSYYLAAYAATADFNRDGNLDIALSGTGEPATGVEVILGNGDGTFDFDEDSRAFFQTGPGSQGVATGDFNGDGKPDIVVANNGDGITDGSVSVLLNNGGLSFTRTNLIGVDGFAHDVAVADMNRDGHLDIVSVQTEQAAHPLDAGLSRAVVWINKGDGTFFEGGLDYGTRSLGAYSVALGDINRDGFTDVVTGNFSRRYYEDCASSPFRGVNTVSVLPGLGDGRLSVGSVFALGDQANTSGVMGSPISLSVADVNNDGAPDILAGDGDRLITTAPDPNWTPSVELGSGTAVEAPGTFVLRASVIDDDDDAVTYQWTSSAGHVLPPLSVVCVNDLPPGTYTFTVTVDDGQGHTATDSVTHTVEGAGIALIDVRVTSPAAGEAVKAGNPYMVKWTASADPEDGFRVYAFNGEFWNMICQAGPGGRTCEWRNPEPVMDNARIQVFGLDSDDQVQGGAESDLFRIVAATRTALPEGWSSNDVGAVQAAGGATFDGTAFVVTGSGADIWGTADEFHWTFTGGSSDFDMTTRVASVQNVNAWTKAGLMMRGSGTASSQHASLFVTPGKGIAFQRRAADGSTSTHTAGPALTAPVWLRLAVRGNTISAYYRKTTSDAWALVGRQTFATGPRFGLWTAGLAVSSHVDGVLASATFTTVEIDRLTSDWTSTDIGAVGQAGTTTLDGPNLTMEGSGADIWGTADAFRFRWRYGTGTISARVRSIENTNAWAKAGVMMREDSTPGARHVMVIVSPGKGVAMQTRTTAGGVTTSVALRAGLAPEFVRLVREGTFESGTFTGYVSEDGVAWTRLGSVSMAINHFTQDGFVVTSHNNTTLATATFDEVRAGEPEPLR